MSAVSMTMPILIVDDYNTMIRILRNLLRQLGFSHIDEANDGAAALAKMKAKDYALVITDSAMHDLMRNARADERTKSTPFVMLTNDSEERVAAGASAYIAKPFSAQSLKSTLTPVLGAF
jgi:two-component system chemotaxis response regulator CheY